LLSDLFLIVEGNNSAIANMHISALLLAPLRIEPFFVEHIAMISQHHAELVMFTNLYKTER